MTRANAGHTAETADAHGRQRSMLRAVWLGTAICPIVLSFALPARAQTSALREAELETVIVTARKREENVQAVPAAVTAYTGEQLRLRNVIQPIDLQYNTPALTVQMGPSSSRNTAIYAIRGIGGSGGSGGVITYFADATGGGGQPLFFDLASVQVLKGPQGTLFGRTSTGGAVLYEPRRPSYNFEGFARAKVGNLDYRNLEAAINVPIVKDAMALRIAGQITRRDGFTLNIDTGKKFDDIHRDSVRVQLRVQPNRALENVALVQYDSIDENGGAQVFAAYNLNAPPLNPSLAALTTACTTAATRSGVDAASRNAFLTGCLQQRQELLASAKSSLVAERLRQIAGAESGKLTFRSNPGAPFFVKSKTAVFINKTTLDLGDVGFVQNIRLKNVYRNNFYSNSTGASAIDGTDQLLSDQVYNPIYTPGFCNTSGPAIGRCTPGRATSVNGPDGDDWSNEVNVNFNLGGFVEAVAGYYYSYATFPAGQGFGGTANALANNVTQPLLDFPAGLPPVFASKNDERGIFIQGTLDLSRLLHGLAITGGHRWIEANRKSQNLTATYGGVPGPIQGPFKDKGTTYQVSVEWKASDDIMLYGRHGTGFRPGGLNTICLSIPIVGCTPTYAPESIKDYELGVKSTWAFGDFAGRTNFALFRTDYTDIQRPVFASGGAFSTNSAKARVKGFEVEHLMSWNRVLTLSMNYSNVDAKYLVYFRQRLPQFPCTDVVANSQGDCQNLDHTKFTNTPKHQLNLTMRYILPLSEEIGEVAVSGNYYWQSTSTFSPLAADAPFATQSPYGLLNGRVDWENVFNRGIDLAVFGRNLTNKTYTSYRADQTNSIGVASILYAEPRTYGIEVRYRFGAS